MRALFVVLAIAVAGCSSPNHPCKGHEDKSCIDATIKGSVKGLDQLHFIVAGSTFSKTADAFATPSPISLPVELALLFDSNVVAFDPATITVQGEQDGKIVAQALATTKMPVAGAPISVTLELEPLNAPRDGGSVPIVLQPASLAFPDVFALHWKTSSVSVTNTSSSDLGHMQIDFTDPSFSTASPPADDPMACSQVFPAKSSCNLYFTFAPTTLGSHAGTVSILVNDIMSGQAMSVQLAMNGNAIAPSYTDESFKASTNFLSVSGTAENDIYASGTGAQCIFHYDGTSWANVCSGIEPDVEAVVATSAGAWLGATSSVKTAFYLSTDKGMTWTPQTISTMAPMPSTPVTAMVALTPTRILAGLNDGSLYTMDTSNTAMFASAISEGIRGLAVSGTTILGVGDSDSVFTTTTSSISPAVVHPQTLSTGTSIEGVWVPPNGDTFFIAAQDASTNLWGVYSIDATTHKTALLSALTAGDFLMGTSGAVRPDGTIDVYAVGSTLVHGHADSTGAFTFQNELVPANGQTFNAVWASPTGEVVVVGSNGTIEHLH